MDCATFACVLVNCKRGEIDLIDAISEYSDSVVHKHTLKHTHTQRINLVLHVVREVFVLENGKLTNLANALRTVRLI